MVFNDTLSQSYGCPGTGHLGLSLSPREYIKVTNAGQEYFFSYDPNTNDIC